MISIDLFILQQTQIECAIYDKIRKLHCDNEIEFSDFPATANHKMEKT